MASQADLLIAIRAVDQASATLNNVANSLQKTGTAAHGSGPGFLSMSAAMATGQVAAHALMGAVSGVTGIVGGAITAFGNMEAELNIFQATTNASAAQMAAVSAKARALGSDLDLPATSSAGAAKAMTELAKAGLSVDQAMLAAKGTLQLAAAAGVDEARAAELTAGALNAFGLSGDRAAQVANQLAYAANASSLNAAELGQSVAQAGFIFKATGRPMEELLGSMIVLGNAGLSGSDGATALKNALMKAVDPTKEGAKEMAKYGISLFDAQGNMKSLPEIIDNLNKGLGGLTPQQRNAALSTIFMSDGMKALIPLMDAGGDKIREYVNELRTTNAATDQATARAAGFQGALKGLQSQWETLQETVGSMVVPALTQAVRFLSEFTGAVAEAVQQGDFAPIGTAIESALRTASNAFYAGGQAISEWTETAGSQIPLVGPLVREAGSVAGDALTGLAAILRNDARGAFEAFANAARGMVTLLGDVADGIARVVTASSQYQSVNDFANATRNLGIVAGGAAGGLGTTLQAIGDVIAAINGGRNPIEQMARDVLAFSVKVLILGEAFNTVGRTIGNFVEIAKLGFQQWVAALTGDFDKVDRLSVQMQDVWTRMGNDIGGFGNRAQDLLNRYGADLLKTVRTQEEMSTAVNRDWEELASNVSTHVDTTVQAVQDGMEQTTSAVSEAMDTTASVVQDGFETAVSAAQDGAAGVADAATAGATEAADGFADGLSTIPTVAADTMDAAVQSVETASTSIATAATTAGDDATANFEQGLANFDDVAGQAAADAATAIEASRTAVGAAGEAVGANATAGIVRGINSGIADIEAAAARAGASAVVAMAGPQGLDEASPSKKTYKLGEDFVQGFINAVEDGQFGAVVQQKVGEMLAAFEDYRIVVGEIGRVEQEIKDIREDAAAEARARATEMITITSEEIRLRKDLAIAEKDLLPVRQELRALQTQIRDAEKLSLPDQQKVIANTAQINQLKLQELQLEGQMIGLDRRSKEYQELSKAKEAVDQQIASLRNENEILRQGGVIAADAYRARAASVQSVVDAGEKELQAIKNVIEQLDAEQKVFKANEDVITNATKNEIAFRERLIDVFKDEKVPIEARITAGRALIDTMYREGQLTKEEYEAIQKVITANVGAKAAIQGVTTATQAATQAADRHGDELAAERAAIEKATVAADKLEDQLVAVDQADPTVTIKDNTAAAGSSIATFAAAISGLEQQDPSITVTTPGLTDVQTSVDTLWSSLGQVAKPVAIGFSANVPSTVEVDGINASNLTSDSSELRGIETLDADKVETEDFKASDSTTLKDVDAEDANFDDADFKKTEISGDIEDSEFQDNEFNDNDFGSKSNARGGFVTAGSLSLVGEEGPELVAWGASGTVIPTGPSMAMLGGAGGGTIVNQPITVNVTVEGSVRASRDLAMEIREELIRLGRTNGTIFGGYS